VFHYVEGFLELAVIYWFISSWNKQIDSTSFFKGFTPDVKIWEVVFDKNGEFKEVKRAYELKGHSAGVYNFSFNSDSTRSGEFKFIPFKKLILSLIFSELRVCQKIKRGNFGIPIVCVCFFKLLTSFL
jgi:hypothetical protein